MSRGPGRIERAIVEAFKTGDTWTVEDLCRAAYPGINRIERKHRIAVRRAAHKVTEQCGVGYAAGRLFRGPSIIVFVRPGTPSDVICAASRAADEAFNRSCSGPRGPRRRPMLRTIEG